MRISLRQIRRIIREQTLTPSVPKPPPDPNLGASAKAGLDPVNKSIMMGETDVASQGSEQQELIDALLRILIKRKLSS